MREKLTAAQQERILEQGIRIFAENGYEKTRMVTIAKAAGLSVGVLYKYYDNKEALFDACLDHGLTELNRFLASLAEREQKPLDYAKMLIQSVRDHAAAFSDTVRLYHEITCELDPERARSYAARIESHSGQLYAAIIQKAQQAGDVRADLDPKLFALYLDNLLMTLQFTYCSPYYRERYRLFTGEDIFSAEDRAAEQLLMFLESAFTFEQKEIPHRG